MKTLILVPEKNRCTLKYVNLNNCDIENVYKNKNSFFARIMRKILYYISFCNISYFYGDWCKKNNYDRVIVFDSCRPYHRLGRFLKKKFGSKVIIYFWNPVEVGLKKINYLKNNFSVYSYSISDCKKYDLKFNQTFLPCFNLDNKKIVYDCCYVGKNKNRLALLEKMYNFFENPLFYVVKDKKEESTVFKMKNKNLNYQDYLEIVNISKSILEILPTSDAGFTLRTLEALFYNKKLITNNKEILNQPFYNKKNILVINDNINMAEIKDFLEAPFSNYDKKYVLDFMPRSWIERFA